MPLFADAIIIDYAMPPALLPLLLMPLLSLAAMTRFRTMLPCYAYEAFITIR